MSCYIVPTATPYMKVAYVPRMMFNLGYPNYGPLAANSASPAYGTTPLTQQSVIRAQTTLFQSSKSLAVAPSGYPAATAPSASLQPGLEGSSDICESTSTATASRVGDKRTYDEACLGTPLTSPLSNVPNLSTLSHPSGLPFPLPGLLPSPQTKFLRPLYCKVCRVTLNAPAQAKQHYEGKSHARRVKMTSVDNSDDQTGRNSVSSSTSSSSSSTNSDESNGSKKQHLVSDSLDHTEEGVSSKDIITYKDNNNKKSGSESPKPSSKTIAEIQPEVYCKVCGVSFNSDKQATQHYKGKTHAKRIRATNLAKSSAQAEKNALQQGVKFSCFMCNIHVSSQEQLECHLKGSRHYAAQQNHDQTTRAIRGHWIQQQGSVGVLPPLLSLAMPPSPSLAFHPQRTSSLQRVSPGSTLTLHGSGGAVTNNLNTPVNSAMRVPTSNGVTLSRLTAPVIGSNVATLPTTTDVENGNE